MTSRLSDIFRLASIFSGKWAHTGASRVLPGALAFSWLYLPPASPLLLLSFESSSIKEETITATPKVVCGVEHYGNWLEQAHRAVGLEFETWYHSPILLLVFACWVLLSSSQLFDFGVLLWSSCLTFLCLSFLSCAVGQYLPRIVMRSK